MPIGRYDRHRGGPRESVKRKCINTPPDGCWVWRFKPQSSGYGTISVDYKLWLAHRYSYTVFVGPIPDGLEVLHKCDNPLCVNPKHLVPGTRRDNLKDMYQKGRGPRRCPKRGVFAPRIG